MEKELKDVQNLLTQVSIISEKYDAIAKLTGENFNIFKILKMETREVKTHSAFLAELLNPKGSHEQGDVFLKLFIEEVNEGKTSKPDITYNPKFDITDFDTKSAEAFVEFHVGQVSDTEGGRIDILITSNKGKIIIENKIYAGDQRNQLVRYNNFDEKAPLFYLTLWESQEPSDYSKRHLEEGTHYKRISYENEILKWLEKCHEKAVNHALLRETLKQYIYLIKSLTGQTLNQNMENELVKLVSKNLENLDAFYKIRELDEPIAQELLKKLKGELRVFAEPEFTLEFEVDNTQYSGFNFQNAFLKINNIGIRFEFEKAYYQGFFYGFYKTISKEENRVIIDFIRNKFEPMESDFNERWIGWYFCDDINWEGEQFLKIQRGEMAEGIIEKLKEMFAIVNEAKKKFDVKKP